VDVPVDHPPRLAVGVVGLGRVGSALALALQRAGHQVVAVSGVSAATRRRAERLLPDVDVLPAEDVARRAGLLLLTVPDDVLPDVVETLAAQDCFRPGQLVAHTSGRHPLSVLDVVRRSGALPLALHPAMTFAGAPEDVDRLAGCVFAVAAEGDLRLVAEALVLEMGAEPTYVDDAHRVLYHCALAWGANYLTTVVAQASDLLTAAGVDQPARMLGPLLGAALDNALRRGDAALTGPVSRGDAGTVAAHLAALRDRAPGVLPAYVALARLTADRALQAGRLDPTTAEALLGVLAEPRREASS
jgi:predicted short-subunit dehydrogenase-like oxidoreductase (DUF2520 family)